MIDPVCAVDGVAVTLFDDVTPVTVGFVAEAVIPHWYVPEAELFTLHFSPNVLIVPLAIVNELLKVNVSVVSPVLGFTTLELFNAVSPS
jgi:hypothetical protein